MENIETVADKNENSGKVGQKMSEREVVIVDGARSAFGTLGGGLRYLNGTDIGGFVVKGLVEKTKIVECTKVDSVFAGSSLADGQTRTQTRYLTQLAGLPIDVSGIYVEMQGGSSLACINHAAWKIKAGMADVVIAGGMESYSRTPAMLSTANVPYRALSPAPLKRAFSPESDRDLDIYALSDRTAAKWKISREGCDEYTMRSQELLKKAYADGITGDEIIPYTTPAGGGRAAVLADKDEVPEAEKSREYLQKLAAVHEDGVTTEGNIACMSDGAAFLLIMTAEKASELGYKPFARWIGGAHIGIREENMGFGAAYSSLKALDQSKLKLSDLDVIECNEFSAAQSLGVKREMETEWGEDIDINIWNPNGGALAIGNPSGASGARTALSAMKQLEKISGRYGLCSASCRGGQGASILIENLRI